VCWSRRRTRRHTENNVRGHPRLCRAACQVCLRRLSPVCRERAVPGSSALPVSADPRPHVAVTDGVVVQRPRRGGGCAAAGRGGGRRLGVEAAEAGARRQYPSGLPIAVQRRRAVRVDGTLIRVPPPARAGAPALMDSIATHIPRARHIWNKPGGGRVASLPIAANHQL